MRMKNGKRVSVSTASIKTIYLQIQGSVLSYTGAQRNKEAVVSPKRHSIILLLYMTERPAHSYSDSSLRFAMLPKPLRCEKASDISCRVSKGSGLEPFKAPLGPFAIVADGESVSSWRAGNGNG